MQHLRMHQAQKANDRALRFPPHEVQTKGRQEPFGGTRGAPVISVGSWPSSGSGIYMVWAFVSGLLGTRDPADPFETQSSRAILTHRLRTFAS